MKAQDDQQISQSVPDETLTTIPLVDLVAQYRSVQTEIDRAVEGVIHSGKFIGGEPVRSFAKSFAEYCDTGYCVPCANGTDALEIALKVIGVGAGDEVIIPAFTFVATLEAVVNVGAHPVLCDIDPKRYTIDVSQVESYISPKTKAIIAVHLYGQMAEMDQLQSLASKHEITLVEDAAQAHGATYKGQKAGGIGAIGTFSFFPGKNLGAYGDAGAIITDDEAVFTKSMKLVNHGRISKYDHETVGRNSRMDALQAAVLSVKLKHLPEWTNRRIAIATKYRVQLAGIEGIVLPPTFHDGQAVYHLFVVRVKNGKRDNLRTHLADRGIETGIHYPIALSKLQVTTNELKIHKSCPESEIAADEVLSLPIYPELSEDQQDYICQQIIAYFL